MFFDICKCNRTGDRRRDDEAKKQKKQSAAPSHPEATYIHEWRKCDRESEEKNMFLLTEKLDCFC